MILAALLELGFGEEQVSTVLWCISSSQHCGEGEQWGWRPSECCFSVFAADDEPSID